MLNGLSGAGGGGDGVTNRREEPRPIVLWSMHTPRSAKKSTQQQRLILGVTIGIGLLVVVSGGWLLWWQSVVQSTVQHPNHPSKSTPPSPVPVPVPVPAVDGGGDDQSDALEHPELSIPDWQLLASEHESELRAAAAHDQRIVNSFVPASNSNSNSPSDDNEWCQNNPRALPCQSLHLVIAKYRESIDWLLTGSPPPPPGESESESGGASSVPASVIGGWGRSVYDHYNPYSPYYLSPNIGHESHAYLKFITDHYDTLPRVVVFVPGFPFDHNPRVLTTIAALRTGTGTGTTSHTTSTAAPPLPLPYTSLMVLASHRAGDSEYITHDMIDHTRFDSEYKRWSEFQTENGRKSVVRAFPFPSTPEAEAEAGGGGKGMAAYDRALFAVSRDMIRRNPKELYESVLTALVAHTVEWSDPRSFGALMEYGWHALFGEEWLTPPLHRTADGQRRYCERSFADLTQCLQWFATT